MHFYGITFYGIYILCLYILLPFRTKAPPTLPPPTSPPPSSPPPTSLPPTIFSSPPSPFPSPRPPCRPCKGRKWALDTTSCQCHCTVKPESCSQKGRILNPQRCRSVRYLHISQQLCHEYFHKPIIFKLKLSER